MPKLFSSIFFKLMLIILVTGLGINVAIIFFFGAMRHHFAGAYHPNLNRYVDYLLEDIGDPPDQSRAREIAAETGMVISYENKQHKWTTAENPVDFPTNRIRIRYRDDRLEAGRYRGRYVAIVKQKEGRLTFLLSYWPEAEKRIKALSTGILLFITALMVGAYLMIRWVLKPLRWLKHGVDEVAHGDLSHRVPLRRRDELRDLSTSFNTMAERLQHLLKSKEQLLLDVSHELRTPVTRMKVALAMMPESAGRRNISEDLKEIEEKITELLETARALNIKASLKLTKTDLSEVIRTSARAFEAGRPAIQISPMPQQAIITIDGPRVAQVIKNVIDNAQKYSPDDADPIEISLDITTTAMVISIRDCGMGIPPEDLDFIFEPFYRTDKARTPKREGYGLGLSLAKNIIDAHGGGIAITSEQGKGTTVKIRLPLRTDTRKDARG